MVIVGIGVAYSDQDNKMREQNGRFKMRYGTMRPARHGEHLLSREHKQNDKEKKIHK